MNLSSDNKYAFRIDLWSLVVVILISIGCNDYRAETLDRESFGSAGIAVASSSEQSPALAEKADADRSPRKPSEPVAAAIPDSDLDGTPFVDTSSRGQATRFVELDPKQTGLELQHVWDPPPRYNSLVVGTYGCGVAIGDFDNDGWQDVFAARQHDAGRLFKNLCGMKFRDVTTEVGIDPQGMWGVGTTFVDINNDGWLDLYICGYECPNRLYINDRGRFSEQAEAYGLDFCGSSIVMTFADYDRDGDLDGYLVTNYHLPDQRIDKPHLIQRRGQPPEVAPEFKEQIFLVPHPNGGYHKSRAGQFDRLFRNERGRFVDATQESGIGMQPYIGLSATWWDYDNNGWPDLYVANDFKGPDLLYRNNGRDSQGRVTFSEVSKTSLPHTPWYSMGSDFGDINNDGLMDYLASDMAGTNHYRDKLSMGSMSGPDSSAWFLNAVTPPQYMRNTVFLNTGTARFIEIANLTGLAKSDWTWAVKFADLDNDGWQDIFMTNGMTRDLFNADLKNELAAILNKVEEQSKKSGKKFNLAQVAADFWKKQEPFRLENMAFRNSGNYQFDNIGPAWGLDHLGISMGAAVGDLDNDGDLDIVVSGFEEPLRLYENNLPPHNSIRLQLIGTGSNRQALGTRVDLKIAGSDAIQTRFVSPTVGFMSTSESVVHFGLGGSTTADQVDIHWPDGTTQALTSLAANHIYRVVQPGATSPGSDIAAANKGIPQFAPISNGITQVKHIEQLFDDFERQPLLPNKYSQLGPALAWGDIDGDGDDDLYIGGPAYSHGRFLENLGGGKFERKSQAGFDDSRFEDMGCLFFDADLDGDLDLYVVSGGVECEPGDPHLQDRLYMNDGKGNFQKTTDWLPQIRESGGPVATADFDRDGDLDLVVPGRIIPGAYPESPRSFLFRNTGSKFEDVTRELAPELAAAGLVTAAVWCDVDGDDWPDLLLAIEWGPIRFFHNDSGRLRERTADAGLAERLGWFNSICCGDIDNDGDSDFVIGNFGLNTKYSASFDKPELLFYGDFEGTGRKHIVEAKYENGVCLPRRGLSCSSHAMPMVKEKLPTYHQFAISSLETIYSDDKLDAATRFEANSLASGLLFNESDKSGIRFRFEPLPMLVQASPVFGSQLVDVDGDGRLDLYVVQNFFGPQRETGYMDGGVSQLLLGDGQGNFQPVIAAHSGLVVPGDAKSLTLADFNSDGQPDFLIGNNNSFPQAFVNQNSDEQGMALRLAKIGGKRLLAGTKIWAEYSDGSRQLTQFTPTSGYLSQSQPLCFFGRGTENRSLIKLEIRWPNGETDTQEIHSKASHAGDSQ